MKTFITQQSLEILSCSLFDLYVINPLSSINGQSTDVVPGLPCVCDPMKMVGVLISELKPLNS